VVGLFAGVGGIELGLERAGHVTRMLCENDPCACAVLETRMGAIRIHRDIRTLGALPPGTDLVSAGFPCQDLSQAGKTAGIGGSRSGLVGEVFRLLERRRAPFVLFENVPFMLKLGKGRALEVIVQALERLGYWWAYRVVDSRAFGLPQRRERVFLVASRVEDPRRILFADDAGQPPEPKPDSRLASGFYWTEGIRGLGWAVDAVPTLKGGSTIGIASPPAILLPDGAVVKPDLRDAERLQGFTAGWTQPAERVARPGYRWKLVGNAVTVDVAEWVGRRLASPGEQLLGESSPLTSGDPWPDAAWSLGKGRFKTKLSRWPMHRPLQHLHEFLRFPPVPLSAKATAGFLARTKRSRLRFPDGFLDTLEAHLARVHTRLSA
jgi:DNA (cytosine-5)-methyltransferase 1